MATNTFEFSEYLDNTDFFCGLDVHKHELAVAIFARDDSENEFVKCETFGTDLASLRGFFGFARKYRPVTFGMEATNVYHHVVANFLEAMKAEVDWEYDIVIAHPADASGIPGRHKHDRVDATIIARYLQAGLLKPGKAVRTPSEDLRAMFRTGGRIQRDRTALKNRIKKTLDRAGFRPVGLNLNTQWAVELVIQLARHDGTVGEFFEHCCDPEGSFSNQERVIAKNLHKFEPYFEIRLSMGQKALLLQNIMELEFKTARLALLAVEMDAIIAVQPGMKLAIERLSTIPGITPYSAAWLVSEIGTIKRYPDVKNFLSYCGLCPRVVRSADRVYSAHLSRRSNKHVRTIFFNAAKVTCHAVKKESRLKAYTSRVIARKKHRSFTLAYCVVAAKIARIAYAMMRDGTSFSPELAADARKLDDASNGVFTIADRKTIRTARNALARVNRIKKLDKRLEKKLKYFADALDRTLREN